MQEGLPGGSAAQEPGRHQPGRALCRAPVLLLCHQRLEPERRSGGGEARGRCHQENLIAQLEQMRALHVPVNTLEANLAYMTTMAYVSSVQPGITWDREVAIVSPLEIAVA